MSAPTLDADLLVSNEDGLGWIIECVLVQILRDMDLAGAIPEDRIQEKVYSRLFSDGSGLIYPAIEVHQEGLAERKSGHDTDSTESWILPFYVDIVDKVGERNHARKRILLRWRWRIIRAFARKLQMAKNFHDYLVPGVWDVDVQTGATFAANREFEYLFSRLQVEIYHTRVKTKY